MPQEGNALPVLLCLAFALALAGCRGPRPAASSTAAALPTPAPAARAGSPQLLIDDSVGPDFAALAQETWGLFLNAFSARTDCFGNVTLRAASTLDSRAGYDPGTGTATVLVPGTPARLQSALIHEWAHHVEFQCPAQQQMRAAFLAAQGLPQDTPWRPAGGDAGADLPASAWAAMPSEQYAEACIEVVLGRRQVPTNAVTSLEAVQVITGWAAGR